MDFLAVTCKGNISNLHIQDTQTIRTNVPISLRYTVQKKHMKISATQNDKKSVLLGYKNIDIPETNEDFC